MLQQRAIFVDTNIYLHYEFFTELPWTELLQSHEVTLIVPPIVMRELDKHKYTSPTKLIKERADRVTKKLAHLLDTGQEVRPGVFIRFLPIEPKDEFELFSLQRDSQDDHLIASILRYRVDHSDDQIILVTNDLGLKVKASYHRIETYQIPDDYRRAAEQDPNEKKVRELERQLRELQAQIPQLKLCFTSGSDRLTFVPKERNSNEGLDLEQNMEVVREQYPKMRLPTERRGSGISDFSWMSGFYSLDHPDPVDIREYNEAVDAFYDKYEQYLKRRREIDALRARTVTLKIEVNNEGTAPANDIGVFIKLPGELRVTDKSKLFSYPKEPEPPKKPKPRRSVLESFNHHLYTPFIPPRTPLVLRDKPNRWLGVKLKDDVHVAEFEVRKLNHGYAHQCPKTLYVIFESLEKVRAFRIDYQITAGNIPRPVSGYLHVIAKPFSEANANASDVSEFDTGVEE